MANRCVDFPLRRLHDDVGLYESAEYHVAYKLYHNKGIHIFQHALVMSHNAEDQMLSTILDEDLLEKFPYHVALHFSFG